jgi:hypothetical protein
MNYNSKSPAWLQKPRHKEVVVATSNGWVVERTGEVLVRVKNLDEKLREYLGKEVVVEFEDNSKVEAENSTDEGVETTDVVDDVEVVLEQDTTGEVSEVEDTTGDAEVDEILESLEIVEETPAPAPKKRGRPAKQK